MYRLNIYIGSGAVLLALVGLFLWVPQDTGTGLIVRVRRQVSIGDALAPTIAFTLLAIGGALLLIEPRKRFDNEVTLAPFLHTGAIVSVIILSLFTMRYAGPGALLVAEGFGAAETEYRLVRETFPWKYIGYFFGGVTMIVGMASLSAGCLRARTVIIAVAATLILIMLVDVPFDDLLLPPNGDY
ncbi:hypothetical protein [Palleronia caenipelagi]|uniref:Tripartite tricarboxylate transporter TctB family protein n=1 Tax=Palleronia caenipelagi TaxID=2489174 RepID=A0A547PT23_9RHOB|nr:hypothetical protein [Palleronia caenipelagi]TRD17285.1 hypothetical protein FEV53_13205 [Palleronia caenipelagi]